MFLFLVRRAVQQSLLKSDPHPLNTVNLGSHGTGYSIEKIMLLIAIYFSHSLKSPEQEMLEFVDELKIWVVF